MNYESKKDLRRRIGKVIVPHDLIDDALYERTDESQAIIFSLMSQILVVRAESLYTSCAIELLGYSHQFDPVPEGLIAPVYEAFIERTTDNHSITTFKVVFKKAP